MQFVQTQHRYGKARVDGGVQHRDRHPDPVARLASLAKLLGGLHDIIFYLLDSKRVAGRDRPRGKNPRERQDQGWNKVFVHANQSM